MAWTKKKPALTDNCILITATWIWVRQDWQFLTNIIKWVDNGDGKYLGWFDENYNEIGDLNELKGDMYLIKPFPIHNELANEVPDIPVYTYDVRHVANDKSERNAICNMAENGYRLVAVASYAGGRTLYFERLKQ